MAKARRSVVKRPTARRTQKFEHGINIGLLLVVVVVVVALAVALSYNIENKSTPTSDAADSSVPNYSSTYQINGN